MITDANPRFFHTGCYSKIGRHLFEIILNFGLDSRLEICSTDKKQMLAEYKCFYFLGNYRGGCCVARALDNEILIARLMMNDETSFGKEESDLLKHEIESFLRIFIEKLGRTIEDEDYPFFISFKDPNPCTLTENEKPFTLRELKSIQFGSTNGKIENPFIIAAKTQLRQSIYDRAIEVEDYMRDRLLDILATDSVIANIYVDGFVEILSIRDSRMREFLEHQIDFNRLSDVYREKLNTTWKVDDRLKLLLLKAIDELEQQTCYKELVETMKELNKLTPVRFIMQDIMLFKET